MVVVRASAVLFVLSLAAACAAPPAAPPAAAKPGMLAPAPAAPPALPPPVSFSVSFLTWIGTPFFAYVSAALFVSSTLRSEFTWA